MMMELRRPARTYSIRQLCQEFDCTPRALRFYEDKGLLAPARDGLNRIYSTRDRARLALILRGKRVGLSLTELREILDLYELPDGGLRQNAASLYKFREKLVAMERQRADLDSAIGELREGIAALEERLAAKCPDLLPQAADYDLVLRRQLDGAEAG
jgi:DNA-binding transcriptional MerR regulator